jgi:hypothetical protein
MRTRGQRRLTGAVTGPELTIVLVAVVIGSISKAVTGMGLPMIVIPIAALFSDIGDAVVVIALPNLTANAVLAVREREHVHEARDLPALALTGAIGAVIGTLLFVNVPDQPLVVALIIAIVVYITTFFLKPDLRTSPEQSRRLSPFAGLLAGTFQGAIGISGPVFGSWIHSFRLPRGLSRERRTRWSRRRHAARLHSGACRYPDRNTTARPDQQSRFRPCNRRHARPVVDCVVRPDVCIGTLMSIERGARGTAG